jgi:hypothetical protein
VSKKKLLLHGLPAALMVLSAAISICAQNPTGGKHNSRPQQVADSSSVSDAAKTDAVKYTYEFSQPKFYVKHIVIEHDANGRGTVTFERLNEDTPITEPIELSTIALARINSSWQALQFLDTDTNYQSDK